MKLQTSTFLLFALGFNFSNSRYLLVEVDKAEGEYRWGYYSRDFFITPGGIGMDTDGLKVTQVINETQAWKAGVKKGDEIHSINMKLYSNDYVKASGGFSRMLEDSGNSGSKVWVGLRRKAKLGEYNPHLLTYPDPTGPVSCRNWATLMDCKRTPKRHPISGTCDMSPNMSRKCMKFCNACDLLNAQCVESHPLCCTEYHHEDKREKLYYGNTCPPKLRSMCFQPFCEHAKIDSEFLGMEKVFELTADTKCVDGICSIVGPAFSFDISRENCLKACLASNECLGVSVGKWRDMGYGSCYFITEMPEGGWDTAEVVWDAYDMWKKTTKIGTTLE